VVVCRERGETLKLLKLTPGTPSSTSPFTFRIDFGPPRPQTFWRSSARPVTADLAPQQHRDGYKGGKSSKRMGDKETQSRTGKAKDLEQPSDSGQALQGSRKYRERRPETNERVLAGSTRDYTLLTPAALNTCTKRKPLHCLP